MNETIAADYKVLSTEAYVALDAFEVIEYLEKSTSVYGEYLNTTVVPPVKPTGGTILLYDLGEDEAEWEGNKRKLRYF